MIVAPNDSPARSRVVIPSLLAALATLVPGIVAVVSGAVLLFPSLGPTAVMMAQAPRHPSSRPYNALVAHCVGLGAAFVSVYAFGLAGTPSVFALHNVSAARVGAAVVSIALGTALELLLRASHPPAASTTLLAALGSFHPTLHDTAMVVFGLLLTVGTGELARRRRTERAPPL